MSASQPYTFSLWNANGLRLTTIQDSLSYVLSSHIFFITETWLTPPMLIPTDWPQFHLYGTKVAKANRGMGGVAALVNPSCPYQVTLLPSPNAYTLSLKVGVFRVHYVYLPPSLKNAQFLDVLESIPLVPNTIICGDFNARLGESLGDHYGGLVYRFSVESAPVESAPVESAPVIYYNFHPYKFCEDIELVLEELVLAKLSSILVKDIKEYNQFDTK
ncbi:hypothetical protein MFLAVUS_010619 [Mucor flavus]|uniref:Endonuclease/exonuclease/phosphatase domain-containing protein n=1 Tax=Mucor flavus TaxID=439312 RepID=A0ABP9ZDD6_9FUNG